jgi:hypothetical protein
VERKRGSVSISTHTIQVIPFGPRIDKGKIRWMEKSRWLYSERDTTNTAELGLDTIQSRHDQWFTNVRHIHQGSTFIHSVTYRGTVQALKAPHILQSRHYISPKSCTQSRSAYSGYTLRHRRRPQLSLRQRAWTTWSGSEQSRAWHDRNSSMAGTRRGWEGERCADLREWISARLDMMRLQG